MNSLRMLREFVFGARAPKEVVRNVLVQAGGGRELVMKLEERGVEVGFDAGG